MKSTKVTPTVRVDGGKRVNLADLRRRRQERDAAMAVAPAVEDTRVSEVWSRAARRDRAAQETALCRRQVAKLQAEDGGKEGAKVTKVRLRISADRIERQQYRCRPGSFEWRYGRNKQDALFHAGSHLAILWERAGMTVASSGDFLRGIRSGYAQGIAEGRVAALDKLQGFRDELGAVPSAQLIEYCVEGRTAAEVAHANGMKERDMATVLHHHLKVCALHFDFM